MATDMGNVLVTGIGGNVGYGILKNIRWYYNDIKITGTNTVKLSPGNHLCDHVYEVPFANDASYIPAIQQVCRTHDIQLIIPATDDETYILAKHRDELPTVAISPAETCKIFLDKYETYKAFHTSGLTFAESILPSAYQQQLEACMVKPRTGRGSHGLHINPPAPQTFTDDYVVQPLLKGIEITTAFYVTQQNELHGHITMKRELRLGYTQYCEVVNTYDAFMEQYLQQLIKQIPMKGSCNIQCMVTGNGIIPFEVNGRISGTNSIRSQFGFKDVCYTIDEYLYNKKPEKPVITTGSAMRILDDIIYPGVSLKDIDNNKDNFYLHT
jgi:carbamoyl-phosphate synthase large subunit